MYKRRGLAVLIILCCFLSSMTTPVVWADTPVQQTLTINEMAAGLKAIGLITGDAKGDLMLQAQLKRSQASQFIVNLLGKNQYVKDNKDSYSTTSFSDVKATDWFAASVGFCQQLGIASGYSDGTFKPNGTLSEKEFLSMLIKALGYTGSDEYTWSTVYQKAYEIMLEVDSQYQTKTEDNKDFKRADVVKLMYTALNLKPKSEELTLIQKMVDSGLITYDKAIASKILKDTIVANISEIKTLNEQRLKIIFNEKISTVKPENIKIYEAANKNNVLSAEIASQTDSELLIKTSKQTSKTKYVIEISKLQDAEKTTVPLATSNFTGYVATDVASDLFMIKKLEQKDSDELNIYFTHPVNGNAVNPAFYEVLENGNEFASASAADITVKLLANNQGINITLKGKQFATDQEYSVRVSPNLISAYGVYSAVQTELPSFIAKSNLQSDGFSVSQVSAVSSKTIQVDFSAEVDSMRAQDIYAYKLTDPNNTQIRIISSQMSGQSVILKIDTTLDTTKTYSLMVYAMTDASGQYTIKNQITSFSGYWYQEAFEINSVTPIDTGSVVATFSKPLNDKSATDVSNYLLVDSTKASSTQRPIKVLFSDKNPCDVKLFFASNNKMQTDRQYILRVTSKLMDYTGIYLSAQKEMTFDAANLQAISMQPVSATLISQDTVKVTFPREIALDSPNVSTDNYSVEYYDNGTLLKKIPIAITYIDNSGIVLKFDQLVEGVDYTFKYKEMKDFAGEVYSDQQLNSVKVKKGM